jgi:hypothetical protein
MVLTDFTGDLPPPPRDRLHDHLQLSTTSRCLTSLRGGREKTITVLDIKYKMRREIEKRKMHKLLVQIFDHL